MDVEDYLSKDGTELDMEEADYLINEAIDNPEIRGEVRDVLLDYANSDHSGIPSYVPSEEPSWEELKVAKGQWIGRAKKMYPEKSELVMAEKHFKVTIRNKL